MNIYKLINQILCRMDRNDIKFGFPIKFLT